MCWKVWSLLVLVKGITFERVALDDKPHAQLSDHFDRCADKIESVRAAGGCTLVHCVAGVSRSVSLCIAYLMKQEHLTLRDAFDDVKKRRPIARPNIGFFRQLIAYERELFDGVNTVKFVPSPIGAIPDVYLPETKGLLWLDESGDDGESRDRDTDTVIGDVSKELQELKVSEDYEGKSSKDRKISSPGDVTPEV